MTSHLLYLSAAACALRRYMMLTYVEIFCCVEVTATEMKTKEAWQRLQTNEIQWIVIESGGVSV